MCGVVGVVRLADRDTVARMTRLLAHRGPDDEGVVEDGEAILGHRRLSILDPTPAGHQPMRDPTGELVVTYNGEIYDYRELRAELEERGHRFDTDTDTEVLLAGYREYGLGVLERIEGIFAFGLWDARDGSLLLARDRMGVKPLFYHVAGEGIAFASELKALRLLPGFVSRPNRRALRSAMRYACNLEDESMLEGVLKLPPGTWLRWKDGRIERGSYWRPPEPSPRPWHEEELAIELRARLQRVVEQQMVSDVPLGAALSGGLDSSGVVALMARTGRPVHAFTVGHGEDDPDLLQARVVAEHTGVDLHELLIGSQDVAELLPRVMWFLEEPLGQMESVQMYANYGAAAEHVKVLLVGEGADELFAGYDRYRLLAGGPPLPRAVRNELYERVYMYADRQPPGLLSRAIARAAWGRLPGSPMADPTPRAPGPPLNGEARGRSLGAALHFDQRTYLHQLSLKRADATGMAHGLELRVPYLGREIVELAATIPASLLLRGGVEKYCLRRALAPLLPETIVRRRKRPFQMALDDGLVRTLDDLCDLLLRPEDVAARGFFEPARGARRSSPTRCGRIACGRCWRPRSGHGSSWIGRPERGLPRVSRRSRRREVGSAHEGPARWPIQDRDPPPMTALPEPLRRLALTTGRRLLGPRFTRAMAGLLEAERLDADALRARQDARLARLVRLAAERVPFWRRTFAERGLAPDAVRTVDDLVRLPVVDRDTLRGEPLEHWIAEGTPAWRRVPYTTSGSTGDPLRFVLDRAAMPVVFASHLYFDSWHDIDPFDRCLRVMGPPTAEPEMAAGAPLRARARARVHGVLQRAYERLTQQRLTTFEADPETVWRVLDETRPDYVMGYTSTLAAAATELARTGRSCPAPVRRVVTIAEPLTPERRAALESWFGCGIANRYGQRELKYWCAQSEPGDPDRFVVVPDLVVAEVLRGDDTPAAPGEVGRLVLTGLHNEVMPFLRYDTRDLAALEPAPAGARRPFPVLSRLCGRSVEVLVTPGGRRIDPTTLGHHLFVVHDHVDAVRAYQLVREGLDLAVLRVVPAIPPGAWLERLRSDLQELLGPDVRCRVQPVAEIPLESSGKRPIIRSSPRSHGVVAPA